MVIDGREGNGFVESFRSNLIVGSEMLVPLDVLTGVMVKEEASNGREATGGMGMQVRLKETHFSSCGRRLRSGVVTVESSHKEGCYLAH